ncbi:MAG: efflux RND transporter periplasmic adaptor subunit [Sphingobacteriaceae bacterium]|nr:efflux RND transporter periplasmic adaptor subunit [Sphingobacteriaceae bacterium]
MKSFKGWLIFVLVLGLLVGLKWLFLGNDNDLKNSGPKGKGVSAIVANYQVAKTDSLVMDIFTTGKLEAFNQVIIHSEASGKITWITDKEGKLVQKGERIAKINDSELQAQLIKLKALLKLAEEKAQRNDKLLLIKGVSQEECDIQKSEVEVIKADVQLINAQIAKTEIIAPFGGVLGLKNLSEGAVVNTNDIIAELVQESPMYIEFSIPEKYVTQINEGMKVSFNIESDNNLLYAELYAIDSKIDEATRSVKVRAKYSGKNNLVSGAFVKIKLDLKQIENAIMVPTSCIIPVFKGQKVFISKNGLAQEVKVITGLRKSEFIQIVSGIHAGDTVLTSGLMSIKNGMPVKLVE